MIDIDKIFEDFDEEEYKYDYDLSNFIVKDFLNQIGIDELREILIGKTIKIIDHKDSVVRSSEYVKSTNKIRDLNYNSISKYAENRRNEEFSILSINDFTLYYSDKIKIIE